MARRLLDFYKFRSKFAALGWEMKKQSRLSRNARRRSPPLDFESLPGEQNMGSSRISSQGCSVSHDALSHRLVALAASASFRRPR